ncbi:MAG TPA: cytochrome P460 family protein [Terracidiphilus sp.]|nr:cytochrome P460 family protein [Terracidiphilus sp.]
MRYRALLAAAFAAVLALMLSALVHSGRDPVAVQAASGALPAYAANGDLLPPKDYRQWTFLTSGFDMSYSPMASSGDSSRFDNVFVNPAAYDSFLATGTWPDKTMLVLEVRAARSRGSINQHGDYQDTTIADLEIHVKDEHRFPGKWAFFSFDSPNSNGTLIPAGAPCYTCHAAHGAVDNTFVQFYPTLLPVARQKSTLSAAFQKESKADGESR